MWHRFFGVGLVMPLDQMHSENPPSHPELLAWLARDTAATRLRPPAAHPRHRAEQGVRAEQQVRHESLPDGEAVRGRAAQAADAAATGDLAEDRRDRPGDASTAEAGGVREEARADWRRRPAGSRRSIAQPTDNFQIGVGEALLFSNGDRVMKEFLTDGGGTALGRVKTMKEPKEAVELLVKTAYGRPATAEEAKALVGLRREAEGPRGRGVPAGALGAGDRRRSSGSITESTHDQAASRRRQRLTATEIPMPRKSLLRLAGSRD